MNTVCLKRRHLLTSISALGLSGCSSIPLLSNLNDSLRPLLKGAGEYPMSLQEIESSPYAMLGVDVGGVSKAIMVLGEFQGRDLAWIAADRSILVTRNGRIVRTAGFETNLRDVSSSAHEPIDEAREHKSARATQLVRQMEWSGKGSGSYPASVELTPKGSETIQILNRAVRTLIVDESVEVRSLDWAVTNRYWMDSTTGAVVRTRQQFHPTMSVLTLEMIRPPVQP